MEIKRIYAENYKTYRHLDLSLEVADRERPIVLIGGANGCGKTTLFDAIYCALYGLNTDKDKRKKADRLTPRQFEELFNAGEAVDSGIGEKMIVLEITFVGQVLNRMVNYRLRRSYKMLEDEVAESVELNMDGNRFVYGTGSTAAQSAKVKNIIDKIIKANLPRELSQYFLFDAMQTGKLVQTGELSQLITDNVNLVMGLSKYKDMCRVAETMLTEKNAERLEDKKKRDEYERLNRERTQLKDELKHQTDEHAEAINFANDHKEEYEQLRDGHTSDEVIRAQLKKLNDAIAAYERDEKGFLKDADGLMRNIEVEVLYPRLASLIRSEVEVIVNEKQSLAGRKDEQRGREDTLEVISKAIRVIKERYRIEADIDPVGILEELEKERREETEEREHFGYLHEQDVRTLEKVAMRDYSNPYLELERRRERLDNDKKEYDRWLVQRDDLRKRLGEKDYSFLEYYEKRIKRIGELKDRMAKTRGEIERVEKEIKRYDFDIPQIPDPQYDTLCRLPKFFTRVYDKLFGEKKSNIERRMKELLNVNLVAYRDVIGNVKLEGDGTQGVTFTIYHKNGNEIYLSQLNAGAKQTVMQVLLKVLYELADYNPPVIIDTVMGVMDKASREVILEEYFPRLSHQTILLSTDTEITAEQDFKRIAAHVARVYTLHRDKEQQCTSITEDYFGVGLQQN